LEKKHKCFRKSRLPTDQEKLAQYRKSENDIGARSPYLLMHLISDRSFFWQHLSITYIHVFLQKAATTRSDKLYLPAGIQSHYLTMRQRITCHWRWQLKNFNHSKCVLDLIAFYRDSTFSQTIYILENVSRAALSALVLNVIINLHAIILSVRIQVQTHAKLALSRNHTTTRPLGETPSQEKPLCFKRARS